MKTLIAAALLLLSPGLAQETKEEPADTVALAAYDQLRVRNQVLEIENAQLRLDRTTAAGKDLVRDLYQQYKLAPEDYDFKPQTMTFNRKAKQP